MSKDRTPVTDELLEHFRNVIARNMISIRGKKRLKQSDVGDFLGISGSGYGKYERNSCADAATLWALAEFYSVPVAAFFIDYDEDGNVSNEEVIKSAHTNNFEKISEGIKDLAGTMGSTYNDRLVDIEKRLRNLEGLIYSGKES